MIIGCWHDDVIKWKHFPRYWPFVRGIHRSPVNFPHKGQWRGALMFSLICVCINGWVNNGEPGDLRPYRGHYDVTVMNGPLVLMCSSVLIWFITNTIWSYCAELTQTDNYHNNSRNNFILTSLIAYLVIQSFFLLITWQDITQQRLTAQSVILYWSRVVTHKILFFEFSLSIIIEISFEWL